MSEQIVQTAQDMRFGLRAQVLDAIAAAAKACGMQRVILFGSRARGDYRARSDIDLAVCGGNYPRFCLDIEEDVPTLLMFDVVNLDGPVQRELLEEIGKDGVTVYEEG